MPGINIAALTKVFPNGVTALDALDLTINDGEFFALLGPSGCGKTTLLRTIAGLEAATSGTIHIGSRDVTRLSPGDRNLAMVFQDYALYPHMTVRDNIAYPLKIKHVGRGQRNAEAETAGGNLSLAHLMDRRPAQLSGGQQQRVALARAIATRPDVFLFDEPLSNLDARLRLEARTFLKQLQRELATTAIFVTHDQSEALALADRMAVMESGVIRQVGTPTELFHRPANVFVAGFIGSTPMNLIPGVVGSDGVEVGGVALPHDGTSAGTGHDVIYGIRPEYIAIDGSGPIRGEVSITENLGTDFLVTVDVGDGVLIKATTQEGSEPQPGDTVSLAPSPRRVLLYDRETGALVS
jgi:multiple sugar transport system ATP-binding protein